MDKLWKLNQKKQIEQQIHVREFTNDTINDMDLKMYMIVWAKQTKNRIKLNQPIDTPYSSF